jgi:hypothetical protein
MKLIWQDECPSDGEWYLLRFYRVFPYGYPYSYVPNIHNQYILILQKPK